MSASALSKAKQNYRQQALEKRKAFHAEQAEQAAQSICPIWDEFAQMIKLEQSVIASYVSAGSEITTSALMRQLAVQGHCLALPVTDPHDNSLLFRHYRPGDRLVKGGFGMLEPESTQTIIEPDVILLPLVGFDASGTRLGRGGGHYDRLLCSLRSKKKIQAIGVAYEVQFFKTLPCETHDEKLNAVITEECVRVFDN